MSAGYLVSNPVSFLLMKETGHLVDTIGDFRVALSVAACGFILFGLVAAVAGLGKRPTGGNEAAA
jgi:type III secretory pathway component EscV